MVHLQLFMLVTSWKGSPLNLKEVKEHIKRELALDQLTESVSIEAFWKEFDARWFYGE